MDGGRGREREGEGEREKEGEREGGRESGRESEWERGRKREGGKERGMISLTGTCFPSMCWADPVVAFTARAVETPWLGDGTEADPAVAFARPAADERVRGSAAPQRKFGREFALLHPPRRPERGETELLVS